MCVFVCVSVATNSEKLESLKPLIRGFSNNMGLDKVFFGLSFLEHCHIETVLLSTHNIYFG